MSFKKKKKNIFHCHTLNNSQIRPSKSLLKSPSGEGYNFLPCLTWFERHNLIGWFCCQKRFHWLTQSTGLNNPVLSESTESMYSWQSVHLCYNRRQAVVILLISIEYVHWFSTAMVCKLYHFSHRAFFIRYTIKFKLIVSDKLHTTF